MFVKMICYGGIDWHDSKMIIQQMKWENELLALDLNEC